MKSRLLLMLCLCLAAGLSACNKPANNNQTSGANQSSGTTQSSTAGESPSAAKPDASGSSVVGTKMDDAAITAKVKAAMLADSDVKGMQINVDTTNGDVKLSGSVDNQTQIDRAVEIARKTEGVANVTNQLTLKQGGQS